MKGHRGGLCTWLCPSSRPLGPLEETHSAQGIMGTQASWSERGPEHIKDTLVTPEILVGLFEGLLDLMKKEMCS